MAIRLQRNGRLLAAVGADLSCPRIWKHPQNGGRMHVCNEIYVYIQWCGNTYLIMWKCIFGYGNTRFCLCQDTGAMNRPLRLTECSHPISWVYVECFAECSPRIRNPFRMHSRNICNVFVICVLHIRRAKVWFLRCKSMVFGVQKGGFYIAKVWFLFLNVGLLQFVWNVLAIRS